MYMYFFSLLTYIFHFISFNLMEIDSTSGGNSECC